MNNILPIYFKFVIAFFLMLTSACEVRNDEQQNLVSILETSFEKIYLAQYGLEYPHTEHSLNRCIQYNYKPCIEAYNLVVEGKKTIISLPAQKALDTTLDIIAKVCLLEYKTQANSICYGAIMALYFYNSPQQDAQILSRVKKYPKELRSIIFNHDFYWYYNRPEYNVWINYISSADVEWKQDGQKQFVLDMFKKSINQVDNEPWVLR